MTDVWGSPDPASRRDASPGSDAVPSDPERSGSLARAARPEDVQRAQAVRELKRRREFLGTLGGWASVSAITTVVWIATGADGYFWPIWPMIGLGFGVVKHATTIWGPTRKEITEEDIAAEMRRRERPGR
ncbi:MULTISPECIES: 2TM domain-containing protein [unclassified Rathayibacter]|uniref:2TM domain-containing protein n=1 Tax=unclassified Rathayibacter TaxID=2609250 RepID=UPI00188A8D24|nr:MULTISPECIES: 2TM domain-containing protein [unclassified Rathayibacter]MBF4462837.1 2TM domain-containing protein [Rathayibacter sp. VKM Ac-2879]MBF4504251.1 2TM domain-containing protein [Rathayibacter sp. VKM Ac-2878]